MQMEEYCEEFGRCRHGYLMEYFGETADERRFPSGRCPLGCDNCERAQQPVPVGGKPVLLTGFDWTEWAAQASRSRHPALQPVPSTLSHLSENMQAA